MVVGGGGVWLLLLLLLLLVVVVVLLLLVVRYGCDWWFTSAHVPRVSHLVEPRRRQRGAASAGRERVRPAQNQHGARGPHCGRGRDCGDQRAPGVVGELHRLFGRLRAVVDAEELEPCDAA